MKINSPTKLVQEKPTQILELHFPYTVNRKKIKNLGSIAEKVYNKKKMWHEYLVHVARGALLM